MANSQSQTVMAHRGDPLLSLRNLSSNRAGLLRLMQDLQFGRIESLNVARGEPVFDPYPRVVREVKLGMRDGVKATSQEDFLLKAEVRELFVELAAIGDGVIDRIEVRHGLPFRLFTAYSHEQNRGNA